MGFGTVIALGMAPLAATPMQANAITVTVITREDERVMRKREARLQKLCRAAPRYRDRLDRLFAGHDTIMLAEIAERLHEGSGGCVRDEMLAIAILDRIVGPDPLRFGDAYRVALLGRYLKARGGADDLARAAELGAMLDLRGDYYRNDLRPEWSADQRRAFIARDDVWSWLDTPGRRAGGKQRRALLDALLDPLSPRRDAARAVELMEAQPNDSREWTRAARLLIDGSDVPADPARAEALLIRAADHDDEAAQLLAPLLGPRLNSADLHTRDAATAHLSRMAAKSTPGGALSRTLLLPYVVARLEADDAGLHIEAVHTLAGYAVHGTEGAVGPVLAWIDGALAHGAATEKTTAWSSLARLRARAVPGADAVMTKAIDRQGGLLAGGRLTTAQFRPFIGADDYPARALREKSEGVVEADAILAPDGRVLHVVITRSAAPIFDETVEKLALRRLRVRDVSTFAGRYVRVTLPPIQFRLPACADGSTRAPQVAGAIPVDASYCRQPIVEPVLY